METLYVIVASQEYSTANHRNLWIELSEIDGVSVAVANIPSDIIVSTLKGKTYRIKESFSEPQIISDCLKVVRPFFPIRPELAPHIMYKMVATQFWNAINSAFSISSFDEVRVIIYNSFWTEILTKTNSKLKIGYYLFDEVRNDASTGKTIASRYKPDYFSCNKANYIFAMSEDIKKARAEFSEKIFVIGNGANIPQKRINTRIKKSVAFVGNFRDWIDFELLHGIIEQNPEYTFYIVGNIEKNVMDELTSMLRMYSNVFYGGVKSKEDIELSYQQFESIIIPYKQNEFVHATRPIKIVEAVLAGTPVVTVPVSGYKECAFIKFASTVEEFSEAIRHFSGQGIDIISTEYIDFVNENTWCSKGQMLHRIFSGEKVEAR